MSVRAGFPQQVGGGPRGSPWDGSLEADAVPALQVRTKDVLFESIGHLIEYHLQNGQPIVAAESELHLRGVVLREP